MKAEWLQNEQNDSRLTDISGSIFFPRSKTASIPPRSVIPSTFQIASNVKEWKIQWWYIISMSVHSTRLHSEQFFDSRMVPDWRNEGEMRCIFGSKPNPLILKSVSFNHHSLTPAEIPTITSSFHPSECHFCHPMRFGFSDWSWNYRMSQECARMGSEWTNRVLSLYRDNTWFVHSEVIPIHLNIIQWWSFLTQSIHPNFIQSFLAHSVTLSSFLCHSNIIWCHSNVFLSI